ncbi:MAG: hypothetical protein HY791_03115 [Deltaproteobacteria bacterium]|nr:hypothetical protein [Deltaproteobacteria bacterium]
MIHNGPRGLWGLSLALFVACSSDDTSDSGARADVGSGLDAGNGLDASQTSFAPDNLDGKTLTLAETGGPTNQWTFAVGAGTAGMATLAGVGDFAFTYAKTAGAASTRRQRPVPHGLDFGHERHLR